MPAEVAFRGPADCKHAEGRLDDRKPAGGRPAEGTPDRSLPGLGLLACWKRRAVRPLGFFGHPSLAGFDRPTWICGRRLCKYLAPGIFSFRIFVCELEGGDRRGTGDLDANPGGVAIPHPNFRRAFKCTQ